MDERFKKKLIAVLLLVSCIISAWLLFITPGNENKPLRDLAQADSLLRLTLSDFNISDSQISTSTIQVDSVFERKNYSVSVPPAFSKTQLHAELQQQLLPYDISLPARVTFPEKDMNIHLYFKQSVIGNIRLRTNKNLSMQRSFATIIAAFDGKPPAYLMDTLSSFGEPIPIAIILRMPLGLPGWWDDFKANHPAVYIWPQTASGDNLLNGNQQIVPALETLGESAPDATLFHFFEDARAASQSLGQTSFSYINTRDAFILNAEAGRSAFNQTFRALVRQSRSGETPIAIVKTSEESLEWTRQELNTFKKGGFTLTIPRKTNF